LPPPIGPDLREALSSLLDRRLLVFLGKGGVGKTTLAAAVGRLLAARGKRVLLCEANSPSQEDSRAVARLPPALGLPPRPPEVSQALPNLWLCNLRAEAALHEYVLLKLHIEKLVKKLLGNKPMRAFLRLIPSLSEVVTLGKLLHHVREKRHGAHRFDAVLFDAPATGHGVSLLNVPQVLLPSMPPGPMREDLSWMKALLVDPRVTAVQLVTLAEELPVGETLELTAALRDQLRVPQGLCFANAMWPSRFSASELRLIAERSPAQLFEAARRLQTQADVNRSQLKRLQAEIDLPVVPLPQVFAEESPAGVTARLHASLEGLLAGLPRTQQAGR